MLSYLAFGTKGGGDDEAHIALFKSVAAAVAQACFEACVSDGDEAPGVLKIVGGLFGIADVKFEIVEILNGHEILFRHDSKLLCFVLSACNRVRKIPFFSTSLYEMEGLHRK